MTIRVAYEAWLIGSTEAEFELEPEEEVRYLALADDPREQYRYLDECCREHARWADNWDTEVDRVDAGVVE